MYSIRRLTLSNSSDPLPFHMQKSLATFVGSREMECRDLCWSWAVLIAAVALMSLSPAAAVLAEGAEKVLTLDHSNFSEIVSKHDFIVVEFYAPWCGHCKSLAPEYEKAASILSNHEPPVVLAKIDANEQENRELATQFEIQGFPTLKILRNGGKIIQEYKGPRDGEGIVEYLKRQLGPSSTEIKSTEDAANLIDESKIIIVGIFTKLSGEEFENFTALAEKMRSDYGFVHTLDGKLIPRGEPVSTPTVRLLKPFDEAHVDSQDFHFEAMKNFIKESTVPLVTIWNNDPSNHPYISKFFGSSKDKVMLFVNFSTEYDAFESKYKNVATFYKGKSFTFLLGDVDSAQNAFQFFGLQLEQTPVLVIQKADGEKYLNTNIEADQIAPWVKDYVEGLLQPFVKSEPIPEVNDGPVVVVVRNSLEDVVINSGKNVLLEFYAPWCGHCQKLAPILEEVAISYQNDPDVIIAKYDATANDVPKATFEVQGFPTVYFRSASGELSQYDGDRTKEDIIKFIDDHRDKPNHSISESSEPEKTQTDDIVKDEL